MLTSLWARGDTKKIVGNAKTKAKTQAVNQMLIILLTKPTLKTLIIKIELISPTINLF